MDSKISKNKTFRDSLTYFSSNAFSFLVYPPRKIKYNLLQEKKFLTMFNKVKFIAKNLIYIKNVSRRNVKENPKQIMFRSHTENGSKVLFRSKNLELRLIDGQDELLVSAQKLRYNTFFNSKRDNKIDKDSYDYISKHLVVIDKDISDNKVVGTYRLLSGDKVNDHSRFYTAKEFNLDSLKQYKKSILEVGRSCVDKKYRDGKIIRMLWKGLASEISAKKYSFVIGCASFPEINPIKILNELSYLNYFHKAPCKYNTRAMLKYKINWELIDKKKIDVKRVFRQLPPLIKAYLRVGAWIGSEAVIDRIFKTIDVCVILKSTNIKEKYLNLGVMEH